MKVTTFVNNFNVKNIDSPCHLRELYSIENCTHKNKRKKSINATFAQFGRFRRISTVSVTQTGNEEDPLLTALA